MAAGEVAIQIPFRSSAAFTKAPKLSVHESGQLHVKAPNGELVGGPIQLQPLKDWKGQHVLSVAVDHLDRLPVYDKTPRTDGTDQDIILPMAGGSVRLTVYLNAHERAFAGPTQVAIALSRGSLSSVLWVGLAALSTEVLAESSTGVSIIAGVDPNNPVAEGELLFVRGQNP